LSFFQLQNNEFLDVQRISDSSQDIKLDYKSECAKLHENYFCRTIESNENFVKTSDITVKNFKKEDIFHQNYHKDTLCDGNTFEKDLIKLETKFTENINDITKDMNINNDSDLVEDVRLLKSATILDYDFAKRKKKFLNSKGFSIESLIGRVLEDR
jgi:hypothetical protein